MTQKHIEMITSWDDITIEVYDKIYSYIKELSPEDVIEADMKTLSVLADMPIEEVKQLDMSTWNMLKQKMKFLNDMPKINMPPTELNLNGNKYNVMVGPKHWILGQFIDYTQLSQQQNLDKRVARYIACFVVPEGKKYAEDYDVEEVVNDLYSNLPVVEALSLSNFFMIIFRSYAKAILHYSEKKVKRLKGIPKQEKQRMIAELRRVTLLMPSGGHSE